jgi:hypothetical protein
MDTEIFSTWFKIGTGLVGFGAGLYYAIKYFIPFLKRKRRTKDEEKTTKTNMKIWEILCELRVHAKASRVSLVQFHNGGKYMDGSSMRRMSISHQSCDPKTPSTMQFIQDALVSRFIEVIDMLHDNDPRERMVNNQFESNTKRFYELHDTVSFSILPIYCSHSMLVYGYITIEWCDLESLDKVDVGQLEQYFSSARSQIGFLLSSCREYR